jgi:hypothetical protein
MRIAPLAHLRAGFHHYYLPPHTPAARGDGTATFVIGAVIVVLVWLLIAIGRAKGQRYSPSDTAPFSGIYEATLKQRSHFGKGNEIPPPNPSQKGPNWELKKVEVSEGWIWVALLLGLLGVAAYSQVDVPRAEKTIAHALGPAVTPTRPPPPAGRPSPERHALYAPRNVRGHPYHRVRAHHRGA